ncbi:MAG: hypothetical protein MUF65_12485 [Rubritepida sp.]|nr:hypothetical protein [Rubritepida sp.]MCU0946170.1 hypothetical protein [Rubritepida sp.]
MLMRLVDGLDAALMRDARLDAALRQLPRAAGTAGWMRAEGAARAALGGALWRVLRSAARGVPTRPRGLPEARGAKA